MADDDRPRPRFDLLTFSGSLIVWSITTALSVTALLVQQKVATAEGAWLVLSTSYHDTVHWLLLHLPVAFGLPAPHLTRDLSARFGMLLMSVLPAITTLLTTLRIRREDELIIASTFARYVGRFTVIVMTVFLSGMMVFSFVKYGYGDAVPILPEQTDDTLILMCVYCPLGFFFGFVYRSPRSALQYGKNFVGAAILLSALAVTGFFSINWS